MYTLESETLVHVIECIPSSLPRVKEFQLKFASVSQLFTLVHYVRLLWP